MPVAAESKIDELRKTAACSRNFKFHKEVEVAVMGDVVNPGQDSTYYVNFFQQLRAFILMLGQKSTAPAPGRHSFKTRKARPRGGLIEP